MTSTANSLAECFAWGTGTPASRSPHAPFLDDVWFELAAIGTLGRGFAGAAVHAPSYVDARSSMPAAHRSR